MRTYIDYVTKIKNLSEVINCLLLLDKFICRFFIIHWLCLSAAALHMSARMHQHTQGYNDNWDNPEQHNNILPGQRITADTEIRQHLTHMRIQCHSEKLCEMYHLRREELVYHHSRRQLIKKACKAADQCHQQQRNHRRKPILRYIGNKHGHTRRSHCRYTD